MIEEECCFEQMPDDNPCAMTKDHDTHIGSPSENPRPSSSQQPWMHEYLPYEDTPMARWAAERERAT